MKSLSRLTIDRLGFALHHATELVKPLEADVAALQAHVDELEARSEARSDQLDEEIDAMLWLSSAKEALAALHRAIAELDGLPKRIGGVS